MKPFLNITLQFDEKAIGAKISDLANDEITMQQIHTEFAKIIDPFVPARQGILASSATPTKDYVEYLITNQFEKRGIIFLPVK